MTKLPKIFLLCTLPLLAACTTGPNGELIFSANVEATETDEVTATLQDMRNAPQSAEQALEQGKGFFNRGLFGRAEESYRKSIELNQNYAEAWLGLAASYDHLRRFDLADRAYAQVKRLSGTSVTLLNNQGYSHMLRGNYKTARKLFLQADNLSPNNEVVKRNLALLDGEVRKSKGI